MGCRRQSSMGGRARGLFAHDDGRRGNVRADGGSATAPGVTPDEDCEILSLQMGGLYSMESVRTSLPFGPTSHSSPFRRTMWPSGASTGIFNTIR